MIVDTMVGSLFQHYTIHAVGGSITQSPYLRFVLTFSG
jgi:hypothetical protein